MKRFRHLLILVTCALLFAACEDDSGYAPLLGTWTNVAGSTSCTLDGSTPLPEGSVEMQFEGNKAMLHSDLNKKGKEEWWPYTVGEEEGILVLTIEYDRTHRIRYAIDELTDDRLTLNTQPFHDYSWEYLVMRRK